MHHSFRLQNLPEFLPTMASRRETGLWYTCRWSQRWVVNIVLLYMDFYFLWSWRWYSKLLEMALPVTIYRQLRKAYCWGLHDKMPPPLFPSFPIFQIWEPTQTSISGNFLLLEFLFITKHNFASDRLGWRSLFKLKVDWLWMEYSVAILFWMEANPMLLSNPVLPRTRCLSAAIKPMRILHFHGKWLMVLVKFNINVIQNLSSVMHSSFLEKGFWVVLVKSIFAVFLSNIWSSEICNRNKCNNQGNLVK